MPKMNHQPPRLAKSLLRRFCHVSFLEEVEGDLDEQFYERLEEKGPASARFTYWRDVLRAVISGNNYKRTEQRSNVTVVDSFSHFLKVFFRNLKHNRSSSFINIAGLALSLMSFVVIYLYVVDELSFDTFHPDPGNVYRISHSYKRYSDGLPQVDARAGGMWVVELKERMPEVKEYTRFSRFGYPGSVRYEKGNKIFEEQQVFWADSTYTDIFNLPMIAGDPSVILKDPHNIIINETIAEKYFGEDDPVGKEIIYQWGGMDINLVVAGVMENYPSNAHFHPDFIGNNVALDPIWKRDNEERVNSWYDAFTYSYFRLEEGTDPANASKVLSTIFRERMSDRPDMEPVLTPLTDIHFAHDMLISLETPGEREYAFIAASVGILILVIAAINYMNLATARSVRRAREVGLRKTLGGRRSSLVGQFMGESFMLILISFALSIVFTLLLLPYFNQVAGKSFDLSSLFETDVLLILVLVITLLGILAGSYPAFYLSAFKPADVLKGKIARGGGAETLRKILVVCQFSITILLVVSALIINNQISFIRSGKLTRNGQTMSVRLQQPDKVKVTFRDKVAARPDVEKVAMSDHLPHQDIAGFMTVPFIFPSVSEDIRMWDVVRVDENFADMFDIDFVAGRNFSNISPADTNNMIINEAAARELGLTPEDVLGRELKLDMRQFGFKGVVIGVTKDFSYRSAKKSVTPAVLVYDYLGAETLQVNFKTKDISAAIAGIENTWKEIYPGVPFKYWFMGQEFDKLYRQETRMGKLSDYFTAFAIVIACLGLFGLASFTAEQKTKEIGIRKVLGASMGQILVLLTNRFIILVLISYAVAIPLAFYAMNSWLENFAYKVPMHWSIFVGAGGLILVLTYITVGVESIRAALANPVNSIRHE